jgi:hypothetical protein
LTSIAVSRANAKLGPSELDAIETAGSALAGLPSAVLTPGGEVLAALADGRLASGGEDGKIKLSLGDEQKLIAAALCRRAGRNLAQDEWARYIGPDTPRQPSCSAFHLRSNWRTPDRNSILAKEGCRSAAPLWL